VWSWQPLRISVTRAEDTAFAADKTIVNESSTRTAVAEVTAE
jgi:hypothetical protein